MTWLAISPVEERQQEGKANKEVEPIEVPMRMGNRPWGYFLYGGTLVMYAICDHLLA
jgi:hypothetical protein